MTKKTVLVSACLLGICVKYNGGHNYHQDVAALADSVVFIPVCPEQLGGLPTPRPPAEISGGSGSDVCAGLARVITPDGEDRTEAFVRGAQETWKIAKATGASGAILKARSPSCGYKEIYDGSFSGTKSMGNGVTVAFLQSQGMPVFTEENLVELQKWLQTGG